MVARKHLVNTVAELTSATINPKAYLADGQQITVAGYYSAGDKEPVTYVWNAASTATANGGTVLAHDEGGDGRFLLLRDSFSVKDFGAVGDGVADDAPAFSAALSSGAGVVAVPVGTYRWATAVSVTGAKASLIGQGSRYNVGPHSKIIIDHTGTGFRVYDQAHVGINLEELWFAKSAAQVGVADVLRFDGTSTNIVSHINMRRCHISGGDVGLRLLGNIFTAIEYCVFENNKYHLYMPGAGTTYPANNGLRVVHGNFYNTRAGGAGIRFAGDAGRNMRFVDCSIESPDTVPGILIESGSTVRQLEFDGLWAESTGSFRLEGGDGIRFKRLRWAGNNPVVQVSGFAAKNVEIDRTYSASATNLIKQPALSLTEFNANDRLGYGAGNFTFSRNRGTLITPSVTAQMSAAEAICGAIHQQGPILQNYIKDWAPITSGNWGKSGASSLATATDPLGGSTAYSWTGVVTTSNYADIGTGNCMLVLWARGKGYLRIYNRGDGLESGVAGIAMDSDTWQRFVVRYSNAAGYATGMIIEIDPDSTGSLQVWRPGIYAGLATIDTRPQAASGSYEGGYIDAAYTHGERRGVNLILYGTASPGSGAYMVGDRVINTTPAAAGFSGWVCTTAGSPGTWKGYSAIES